MITYWDQKWLGEEWGYFTVQLRSHISSLKDAMAGTEERQVPEDGNRNTGHAGVLFPGLQLMAFSVCFLIAPRTPNPVVTLFTVILALPQQSTTEKMHHRPIFRIIHCGHFFNWGSHSQASSCHEKRQRTSLVSFNCGKDIYDKKIILLARTLPFMIKRSYSLILHMSISSCFFAY